MSSPLNKLVVFILSINFTLSLSLDGRATAGVFALPEIHIRLKNGTVLQTEPNTPVELPQQLGFVELSCTADYPVKWEYLIKNKTIPVIDVVYRRLIRPSRMDKSDFSNPKRSRFMALITLRGLLESQTGKYLCRQYNDKLDNNSYAISSYFDIFVSGNRTFNTITTVKFLNKTALFVNIHCPITTPNLHVRLYKLNEKHFNKTKEISWKPIYANYEPTDGFTLFSGLGRELLGTYNCTADNGQSVLAIIADPAERDLYISSSKSFNSTCWGNTKFMQFIRSKRLECYCKDSYGLFMNDDYEFVNRQAFCPLKSVEEEISGCKDWRVEEFFRNGEDSRVCFREETVQLDGSGYRPNIKVKAETFPSGDNLRNFSFTKLNITYNGLVDWAGDFKLAVCREEFCLLSNSDEEMKANETTSSLEFIKIEPSHRQYFPLAYFQAFWKDLIVNGTDIKSVYVLQAHSLSYAWFPYATGDIQWDTVTRESKEDGYSSSGQALFISSTILLFQVVSQLF